MLVFSLASSVNPPGVAKDTEAVNVAPVSLVADALVVTCDARGKGKEAESKSGKLNHERSTGVKRPGKGPQRDVSPSVASGDSDAQYLAEVAATNAVLRAYKRRRSERRSHSCHVGVRLQD